MTYQNKNHTTIREVAQYANVSVSTISKVINNKPGVKKTTLAEVNEAIKILRYVPNAAARELRTTRSEQIVAVMCGQGQEFEYPADIKILLGIIEKCGEYDLVLRINNLTDYSASGIDKLISKYGNSFFILTGDVPAELAMRIRERNLRGIVIGNINVRNHLPNIRADGKKAGFLAASQIIDKRYDKFSSTYTIPLTSDITTPIVFEFSQGYMEALAGDTRIDYVNTPDHLCWVEKEVAAGNRIAIICNDDPEALRLIAELSGRGVKIPEQVGIIGIGNSLSENMSLKRLSTVDLHFREMGSRAVDFLLSGTLLDENVITISPDFVQGETI